jgi:drug/metabolite transporter (DMT)-like permease
MAYRFLIAAAVLAPFAKKKHMKESAILAGLLTALYISQTIGLGHTSASNSGFITGLFVLFVPLFLFAFFKKRPTLAQWGASILALGGLWLLTGGVASFNQGDAMTLLAAMTYAGHLLATDVYVKGDADPLALAFHQFWMTGLASLAVAGVSGASFAVDGARGWQVIVFLALVPTASAFYVQMLAQRKSTPLKVSLIFSLEPVFAAVFAWTLGGEPFVAARAAGGLLIVAAMVIGELSKLDLLKARKKEVIPA